MAARSEGVSQETQKEEGGLQKKKSDSVWAERGRMKAARDYSWDHIAWDTLAVYKELCW